MSVPPTVGAFDAPTTQFEVNNEWLSYLFELVGIAARSKFWAGNDAEKADAVREVEAIITAMMIGNIRQQVGEIVMHALEELPANWLWCNGSVHSRVDYPELYAVLHPALINNADEFTTPNMMGRAPFGAHWHPAGNVLDGMSFDDGGGEKEVTLETADIPSHNHGVPADHQLVLHKTSGTTGMRVINTPSGGTAWYLQPTGGTAVLNSGGGTPHNNMPPFRLVHFAIVAR